MRTARGRMVTSKAYRHLGLKAPKRAVVEDLFDEPGTGNGEPGIEAKQ
jgi:Holliday junction DNA helicase RuvB